MFKKTFDDRTVDAVWQKARTVFGWDSTKFRKDSCGATIQKTEYGNRNSDYGWEIDHIDPDGPDDDMWNLQPLQWENNVVKSDNRGRWSCAVTA